MRRNYETKISFIRAFALLSTCAHLGCDNPEPPASSRASLGIYANAGERGGALYDNWWQVLGLPEPVGDHPLWNLRPDKQANARAGAATWLCHECHGWDYRGVGGIYGAGDHKTGIVGILNSALGEDDLLLELKGRHGYGAAGLADDDLRDLAKFSTEGAKMGAEMIGGAGAFIGQPGPGELHYGRACRGCHGPDGLKDKPPGSRGNFDRFPGRIASNDAWAFLHKVRFGQPGTNMRPQSAVMSLAEISDLGAYAQTLPKEKP